MLIFLRSIQVLRVSEHEYKTNVNGGGFRTQRAYRYWWRGAQVKPYNQKTAGKVVRDSDNTVSIENTLDRGKSVALDVGSKK